MRILLISHTCQSRTEGQPKARCLAQLPGVELRVIVPRWWKHYGRWRAAELPAERDFDVDALDARWPWAGPAQFYLHWYPQLRRVLHEFRPDVIDLWEEPWGLVSAHACRLRNRICPAARIVSETEQNIDKTLPFPFERFRAYTLRNADYAVARNAEAVRVLRAKGYTGPAEVVPNAVDTQLFRPMDRDTCRSELGVRGFVVGYVGRLVEEKGLTDLVDALPACPPQVNAVFVGSGPLGDELIRRADHIGVGNRVRFIPGLPLDELPKVMNAFDLLALPSRTTPRWKEQFGRVLIEAQACGVPVVGSDSGAIPEVVGGGGVVVPERDPSALAAAINALAADAPHRARLAEIGRRQVEVNYTWERVARRMHAIYEKVLRGAPRDARTGPVEMAPGGA
jgi:glycosyltransferase involved in cell wall biosynthesis